MSERYHIVDENPNETNGGGCVCSESRNEDCKGPFAVFYHQEMASNLSPHVVICRRCLESAADAATTRPVTDEEGVVTLPPGSVQPVVD